MGICIWLNLENNCMAINFDDEGLRSWDQTVEVHLLHLPSIKMFCVKIALCPVIVVGKP